jgi:hypothetical protein
MTARQSMIAAKAAGSVAFGTVALVPAGMRGFAF